jgi:hypothetical protein
MNTMSIRVVKAGAATPPAVEKKNPGDKANCFACSSITSRQVILHAKGLYVVELLLPKEFPMHNDDIK